MFSKLSYCSTVWANTSKTTIHKLQLVQNFAARIILGPRKFDHISEGLKSLRMLSVKDRLEINDSVMVFKWLNNLVPNYLCDQFQMRSSVSTRVTRSVNTLNIPRCRLATGQRRFWPPVEGLCCKPKYRANITHHFIFVFFVYFSYHSSCPKDQFNVLNLKFGTQDFADPGLLKIRRTLTGLSLWFCLHGCFHWHQWQENVIPTLSSL